MLSREPGHRPDEPRPIRSQLHHPTEKRLNRRRDNKSRAARCLNGAPHQALRLAFQVEPYILMRLGPRERRD
jgi:hypothetical protein